MRAYFTEGEPIGDPEASCASPSRPARRRRGAERARERPLRGRGPRGRAHGHAASAIAGVPFFVLGRRYGVSGAQSADVMLEALEKAWSETQGAARLA